MPERVFNLHLVSEVIPILNRYCNELKDLNEGVCSSFSEELSNVIGSKTEQDLNDAILYLDKELKSHPVLLYVMQHRSAVPRDEEKPLLAKAYKVKNYDDPDRSLKQDAYWKKFLASHVQKR